MGYVRTRTTVLGEPGPVTADGVAATLIRKVGPVSLAVDPSLFRVRDRGADINVRRLVSRLTWRVKPPLSVVVSHQFTRQSEVPGARPSTGAEIAHNTFQIGFAAASAAPLR